SDLPRYAAELLALAPELILANANPSVDALQKIDRTIPIVFVAMTDPVGSGVAQSLAQPGGNATGFTTAEIGLGRDSTCQEATYAVQQTSMQQMTHQARGW